MAGHSTDTTRLDGRWLPVLATLPYAVVLVALADCLHLPWSRLGGSSLQATAWSVHNTVEFLVPFLFSQAAVVVIIYIVGRGHVSRRIGLALLAASAAVMAVGSYKDLVAYHPLAGRPLFMAIWAVLGCFLVGAYWLAGFSRGHNRLAIAVGATGVLASIGICYANSVLFPTKYPAVHLSLFSYAFLVGHAGMSSLAVGIRPRPPGSPRRLIWSAPAMAAIVSGLMITALGSRYSRAGAFVDEYTALGWSMTVYGARPDTQACTDPAPALTEREASALFHDRAGLPALPDRFRITDYNVLLVASDATRFDQTSLAAPNRAATPSLEKFAAGGAFTFDRAYSAATRTLLSIGSLFAQTYPSHAPLITRIPPWTGELRSEVDTPAELFAAAGYDTFAFTHDLPKKYELVGIDQGFVARHREPSRGEAKLTADEHIVDRAIAELDKYRSGDRRFFGWVFMVSAHHKYMERRPPTSSMIERYRQEIENVDTQFGRLIDSLRERGLLERTVVIFLSDHGDEIGEHGLIAHGMALYDESVHVPLLIRIPGVTGTRRPAPTSINYLFPWLFAHGNASMRAVATDRIRHDIAPMLAATGGAVVAELTDAENMKSALIYSDYKIIYNYFTNRREIYDLQADPGEHDDLFPTRADPTLMKQLDSYRRTRACNQRIDITREPTPLR